MPQFIGNITFGLTANPVLAAETTPAATQGHAFFDAVQLSAGFSIGAAGNALNIWQTGCCYSQYASSTAVAASATNSTLFAGPPAAVGSRVLPAGFLVPGRSIRVRIAGLYTSSITLANNALTLKFNLVNSVPATVQLAITPAFQLPIVSANTNATFTIDVTLTCRSTSATGTVFAQGTATYASVAVNGTTANNVGVVTQLNSTAVATVNTTLTNQIDVTATTGAGVSAVTVTNCTIEILN